MLLLDLETLCHVLKKQWRKGGNVFRATSFSAGEKSRFSDHWARAPLPNVSFSLKHFGQEEYRVENKKFLKKKTKKAKNRNNNNNKTNKNPPRILPHQTNKQTKEPNQTKKPSEAYLGHKDGHIFYVVQLRIKGNRN